MAVDNNKVKGLVLMLSVIMSNWTAPFFLTLTPPQNKKLCYHTDKFSESLPLNLSFFLPPYFISFPYREFQKACPKLQPKKQTLPIMQVHERLP